MPRDAAQQDSGDRAAPEDCIPSNSHRPAPGLPPVRQASQPPRHVPERSRRRPANPKNLALPTARSFLVQRRSSSASARGHTNAIMSHEICAIARDSWSGTTFRVERRSPGLKPAPAFSRFCRAHSNPPFHPPRAPGASSYPPRVGPQARAPTFQKKKAAAAAPPPPGPLFF